jgi:hypothetical protein
VTRSPMLTADATTKGGHGDVVRHATDR